MHVSKRLLLGLGLATLIMESVVIQPAFAADKVSLFKVITAKDEIVIGISEGDLAQIEGQNAGGVAKMLVAKGSMSAWQYAPARDRPRRICAPHIATRSSSPWRPAFWRRHRRSGLRSGQDRPR